MIGQGFHFPKIPDIPAKLPVEQDRSSTIGTVQELKPEETEQDLENYFDNAVFKFKGMKMIVKGKIDQIPADGPDVPDAFQSTLFESDDE